MYVKDNVLPAHKNKAADYSRNQFLPVIRSKTDTLLTSLKQF